MGLVKFINNIKENTKVNCEPVKIEIKEDARPYATPVARRVPIPLMQKVEADLKRMKETGVIEGISEPTEWVSPIVPAVQPNGQVRICVDLKKLNENVEREIYIIPTIDDIIHKVKDSKVFSKLDAASGYHQIPLDEASAKLTTFITPYGRFYFKRLPFGISSGPEIFQRLMIEILKDKEGVVCYFDDILIHTADEESHRQLLMIVKDKLQEAGLKLNEQKCTYLKKEIKFLGHIISPNGVKPDRKSGSHKEHARAYQCSRTQKIPRNGSVSGKIHRQSSNYSQASQLTFAE
ncbi:Pol polyprotein [Elysia marginata]|uniref:Pol polyprotein n=1 Tax=Elysia marginata TaxID=1093978 RepID=A0AAV4FJG1_9GAST|nr:Pol polyprotein [Elysia marginata]